MRAHTRICPCCNAVVSAAIHPDDFKCPNGKRRANGGIIRGGQLAAFGIRDCGEHMVPLPKGGPAVAAMAMNLTGPKALPSASPAASGATININVVGINDPREIARAMNELISSRA